MARRVRAVADVLHVAALEEWVYLARVVVDGPLCTAIGQNGPPSSYDVNPRVQPN